MNPMMQAAIGAFLRWAFTFAAGWFVQHGIWTGSEAEKYVAGAAMGVLTLAWGLWNKYRGRIKFLTALLPGIETEAQVEARMKDPARQNPSVTTDKHDYPL